MVPTVKPAMVTAADVQVGNFDRINACACGGPHTHTPKHMLRNRYTFIQWRTVSKDTHRDSQPHGRAVSKMFLPHFLWGPIRRAQSSAEPVLFHSLPLHMPALHDSQTGKNPDLRRSRLSSTFTATQPENISYIDIIITSLFSCSSTS